jgi:molybdopterin-synthase adenylyltransferase
MSTRFESQSFLGPESDAILAGVQVGIVGLGGGGSHIAQQLAHVGVQRYVPVDHDIVELKNLNRVVGATAEDVKARRPKVQIAERIIRSINPTAEVIACRCKWQEALKQLRGCDLIFGCVDSYRERDELERFTRRHLIVYLDLGMDVHEAANRTFVVSGQTVLSSPGGPCLWCLGILNEDRITREAQRYGRTGARPQVVWSNGVLASLAVGLFVQLLCPWHGKPQIAACCEFDGNRNRVETSRLDGAPDLVCNHFKPDELGDAFF